MGRVGPVVTQADIRTGLGQLGVDRGDLLIVHSSLSSFGIVEGGAEAVVDAILDAVGPEGTLVVPTFNFSPGVFDPAQTPSVMGRITEVVRARTDAVRSLHPTHSVAAVGPLAEAITEGHENADAFGRGSPLWKALQANAKILQLGVTHTSNSMIHVAEEIVGAPYLERTRRVGVRAPGGMVVQKWIRRPGCSRGFDKIEEELAEREIVRQIRIGSCTARLMRARSLVEVAVEMLRFSPDALLCDLPECEVCAESRAMIDATETERQDREVTELQEQEERTINAIQKRFGVSEINGFEIDGGMSSPN